MDLLVPFDARDPNTRLAPLLAPEERRAFARAMLRDVLAALRATGHEPTVLATAAVPAVEAPVTVDERPLTPAVNDALSAADGPVAVVMADLALATPAALDRLLGATGEVVIAPGRAGGTNALVVGHPDFRVDYHGTSVSDHRREAAAVGASLREVDSFRLAVDVDAPRDALEVLLHAEGRAPAWLRDAGVSVAVADGTPTVVRSGDPPDSGG